MFRRRDGDDGFGEDGSQDNSTSFGGFGDKQSPREVRDSAMNEEAVDTLSSQRSNTQATNLFKTATTETSSSQPKFATPKPAKTTAATTSFANIGSSASATSSAAPKPTTGSPSSRFEGVEAERRLTVGYGITLNGKISDCDKLIIYGTVDAELDNVKTLHISESGTFKGTANIDQAEISGTFEGDINVADTIVINTTGRVSGKITYGSIEIRPGGKFTGQIVEAGENPATSAEKAEKPKAKKKAKKAQEAAEEFTLAPEPLESEEIVA